MFHFDSAGALIDGWRQPEDITSAVYESVSVEGHLIGPISTGRKEIKEPFSDDFQWSLGSIIISSLQFMWLSIVILHADSTKCQRNHITGLVKNSVAELMSYISVSSPRPIIPGILLVNPPLAIWCSDMWSIAKHSLTISHHKLPGSAAPQRLKYHVW